MRAAGRKGRSRGVSMVEILVALAILGLLATLSLGGVRMGVRTWETVDARVEAESQERVVRAFLGRTLSQALPVTAPSHGAALFEGDAETLSLVAPLGDHIGLGGAQHIRLTIEESAGNPGREGRRLVMYRKLHDSSTDVGTASSDWNEAERHVLVEGIAGAEFSYLRAEGEGEGEWVGRWNGELPLPRLVRLSVTAGPDARPWPDIVAVLRIDATGRRR